MTTEELEQALWLTAECLWWACLQGTGREPLEDSIWHGFLSAYENAEDLFRALRGEPLPAPAWLPYPYSWDRQGEKPE